MCNNTSFAGTRDAANRSIRFDIRMGKFTQWMGQGQQSREFDYVQGYLTGISLRKHEMPTGEMTYLDVHFKNGEIRFDVSAIASGSVAAELISNLVPIIFIDEADALLGRRVAVEKASDKEENTSASVILEELNTFSGILFAATNFITTIDPAMYRRFLMKIEFPVPGRDVLAKIWRAKLPRITAEDAEALAERFHLAGAVIDNVVGLCILEKIVDNRLPTLEQVIQYCEEQMGKENRPPIGFRQISKK